MENFIESFKRGTSCAGKPKEGVYSNDFFLKAIYFLQNISEKRKEDASIFNTTVPAELE